MSHAASQLAAEAASASAAGSSPPTPLASLLPQLTFTQGFLVGQISVVVIVVALIRYLLLEDPPGDDALDETTSPSSASSRKRRRGSSHFPVSAQSQPLNSSLLSLSLSLGGGGGNKSRHAAGTTSGIPPHRVKSPPPPGGTSGTENPALTHGSGPSLPALQRIPAAVGYDMETAADTDVGWLNVLLAHAWAGYRDDFLAGGTQRDDGGADAEEGGDRGGIHGDDGVEGVSDEDLPTPNAHRTAALLMQEVLNRPKIEQGKLEFLDEIQVTECLLGDSYPTLSNARVRPRDDQGRVRVEIDVDYNDVLSLALRSAILVNYPRPRFAVLPISLGVRVTRFSGTLSLSLTSHPPDDVTADKRSRHTLEISLHPDFLLAATCSSLVGSRAKLQDIPKIQQLILQRIRAAIMDRVGWPRCFTVELPDLVRRARYRRREDVNGDGIPNGYATRGDASDFGSETAEEEEEEYDEGPDAPLDPQEALRRMRIRRRLARQRREREEEDMRLMREEDRGDADYGYDDYEGDGDDPERTPRRRAHRLPRNSKPAAATTANAIPRTTMQRSPSQYTSISRRRPNPLHRDSAAAIGGGGSMGTGHRQPQKGTNKRRDATMAPRNRNRNGTVPDVFIDDDDDEGGAARSSGMMPRPPPPGGLPTVEAWRKEMVKRTHGA